MKRWYVYIVNKSNGMYVGMTSDMQNRLRQHGWPKLEHLEIFQDSNQGLVFQEKTGPHYRVLAKVGRASQ